MCASAKKEGRYEGKSEIESEIEINQSELGDIGRSYRQEVTSHGMDKTSLH